MMYFLFNKKLNFAEGTLQGKVEIKNMSFVKYRFLLCVLKTPVLFGGQTNCMNKHFWLGMFLVKM